MINVSAAMGGQFAWSAAELTEEIRRLGPNPLRNAQRTSQDEEEQGGSARSPESSVPAGGESKG
jgi:hypothetical protein